ncbi:MAG: YggU family protein [Deltaproteobacteria bacterium RIFOXYD12_FULL_56_24]|nr:MAG: YggU family protein [Deltaproteobacteria bacterium RIFOXYD12_FULL_56_24]
MTFLRAQADDASISLLIHVQPKASRTRLAGLHGEALKLCITSPPVDGKANAAVIKFFAKLFKIPKAAVAIAGGEASRDKRLILAGISAAQAEAVLRPLLAP